ncbi:Panacea domain-containing protein [Myxococcota bacterium]
MADVHDIAAFFLRHAGPMTTMKLQKLVYYGQAWALVLLRRPLFREDIQAWAYGPVVRELFLQHRGKFVVADVEGQPERIVGEELCLLQGVLGAYGGLDGYKLSERTHKEEPWRTAREGLGEGEKSSRVISHAAMRAFYSQMRPPFHWAG